MKTTNNLVLNKLQIIHVFYYLSTTKIPVGVYSFIETLVMNF